MNDLLFIISNIIFAASFVSFTIVTVKVFLKKYLSSFMGNEKIKVKRTEEIQRFIDEYKES